MRTTRVGAFIVVATAAALSGGRALAEGDFLHKILQPTQEQLTATKKMAKDWFKSGKFPAEKLLAPVTKDLEDLVKSFVDGCPSHDKIAFSDASHYADPKTLKEWKLATNPPAEADCVPGAQARFYATWSAKPDAAAPDVVVTVSELRQRVYSSGAVQDSVTKFAELGKDAKNAQVADVLQALVDDWVRTNPGAAVQKPAKKAVGIAKWFASVSTKSDGTTAVARRDWYAWETQGVNWMVQGTTWVATVRFTNAAAADAKAVAKPEELLKNIVAVIP